MQGMFTSSFFGTACPRRPACVLLPHPGRCSFSAPSMAPLTIEAAHKKGSGSSKNGRDSISKRRGVKVFGGQAVGAGGIIIRQLGTKVHPGKNVGLGKDYTLYSLINGIVMFSRNSRRQTVSVLPNSEYEIPEGQRLQPDSRRGRRRAEAAARAAEEQAEPKSSPTVEEETA